MISKPFHLGLSFALSTVVLAGSASASDTGLAQVLHDMRREGGKICLTDHFHYASSTGLASKRAAELVAKRNWADFTAFEYGTDWANPSLSGSQKLTCTTGGGTFGCEFESRPCKGGGGGGAIVRRAKPRPQG